MARRDPRADLLALTIALLLALPAAATIAATPAWVGLAGERGSVEALDDAYDAQQCGFDALSWE